MNKDVFFKVEMGTKVSQYPIQKYSGSDSRRDLITLLHTDPFVSKTHYHQDVGSFYFLPEAEKLGIDTRVHYNFMAVKWNTDHTGKLLGTDMWEIIYLSVGVSQYDVLVDKFNLNGDLSKLLMQVRCTDSRYQKLSFEIAGPCPRLSDKTLFDRITKQAQEVSVFLSKAIARTIDSETLHRKLREGSGSSLPSSPESGNYTNALNVATNAAANAPLNLGTPTMNPPLAQSPAANNGTQAGENTGSALPDVNTSTGEVSEGTGGSGVPDFSFDFGGFEDA